VTNPSRAGITSFAQILAISLLNGTAVYAIRPMASYRALQLGAGPVELGLIASSYAALSLFAALLIGRWTDRFGPPRFMVAGASLLTVSALSAIWIESIIGLAIGQALLGLGQIMNLVSAQTLVANQTTRDRRDERFGLYAMVASGGQLIGPAVAGLIAGGIADDVAAPGVSLVPVFLFAAVVALASASLSAFLIRQSRNQPPVARSAASSGHLSAARAVLGRPSIPQAMLASLAVILTIDLLVAYLPAYGEANHLPVELIGLLLATRAGGSMVSRLFMGRLIRQLGRGHVLTGSMLVAGVAIAMLPFLTNSVILIALMLVLGFGLGVGQPMTIAWVANRVPREERGTALGVRLTGNRLGQLVLPAIMGTLAGAAGLAAMFWALALVLGGGALMVFRTQFEDRRPVSEESAEPGG
jgi:MFS family permease